MTGAPDATKEQGSRTGAVLLGAYACVGQFKSNPVLAWVPVDLTVVVASLLGVACVANALRRRAPAGPGYVPVIASLVIVVLGTIPVATSGLSESKLVVVVTLTMLAMVSPYLVLRTRRQFDAFVWTVLVTGLAATVLVTINPAAANSYSALVMLEGSNTIGTARVVGAGAVVAATLAYVSGRTSRFALLGSASLVLLATMLATGSRGPFIAALVAMCAPVLVFRASKRFGARAIVLPGALAAAVVIWFLSDHAVGTSRIAALLSGQGDASSGAREYLWGIAWQAGTENPLGYGWGGFAALPSIVGSPYTYPHNVLVEIFVEAGWLGGIVFAGLLLTTFVAAVRRSHEPRVVTMLSLLVFATGNAMVSGDVNDNRLFWIALAATWVSLSLAAPDPTADRRERDGRPTLDRRAGETSTEPARLSEST